MEYSFTVYNIFKCHIPHSRDYIKSLEQSNDFLALQEWVDSLSIEDGSYITAQSTFTLPLQKTKTGTATISKFPPQEAKTLLSCSRELGFATYKSSVITTYELENNTLTIVNCHAPNFVTNTAWNKTLDYWTSEIPETGACIVSGDFNTWNRSRLTYLQNIMQNLGYSYVSQENKKQSRLDHIWYRDITVTSSSINKEIHLSDHYPLSLNFKL